MFGRHKVQGDAIHPDDRNYYGRRISRAEIESDLRVWNKLPPREMRFCQTCGGEVRWVRESAGYSVRTGRKGHHYHLKCVLHGKWHWHRQDVIVYGYQRPDGDGWELDMGFGPPLRSFGACHHYDSHEYRWIEGDADSYPNDAVA